jgi:hypothetical protein
MTPAQTPNVDLAQTILDPASGISDATKAGLWDAYHGSNNTDELQQRLDQPQFAAVDDSVKASLWSAKNDPQTAMQKLALTRPDLVAPPPAAGPVNPITQQATTTPDQYARMTPAQQAEFDRTTAGDRSLLDPVVGAVKGAGQTVNAVSKGISKVAPSVVRPQDVQAVSDAEEQTNPMQQAGGALEAAGEYELGGALFDSLEGLPLIDRIKKAGEALDIVKNHPVLARAVGAAVKGASVGGAVGGAHGGEKGAVEGAAGGAILGAAPEVAGGLKDFWGSLDGQQIQSELQDGIKSALSDAAEDAGVKPADSNVRNSAKAAGDAVLEKSKGLYGQIDDATDGALTNLQDKLKNVNLKLRTTAGTDDAAEELLESQRDKLEQALEDVFDQAKANGVDASVVDDARNSFKQSQALYDLDAQVKASTFGNAKQAAENVNPKLLVPRLQKLADSGRLQEALGDKAADDLLGSAYKSHEAIGDLADQAARRGKVARNAGDVAKLATGGAIGGGIVGAIYHALTGKKEK